MASSGKQINRTSFHARRATLQANRIALDANLRDARAALVSNPADEDALATIESTKTELVRSEQLEAEINTAESRAREAETEASQLAVYADLVKKRPSVVARRERVRKLVKEWQAVVAKLGPLNYAIERELQENASDTWPVLKAAYGFDDADKRWHPVLQSAARVSGTGLEAHFAHALWITGLGRTGVRFPTQMVDINRVDQPERTIDESVDRAFDALDKALAAALEKRAQELGVA